MSHTGGQACGFLVMAFMNFLLGKVLLI